MFPLQDCKWTVWIYVVYHLLTHHRTVAETRVSASAPVNPVHEGDILSLYCQIYHLQDWQSVEIHRKVSNKPMERLSVGESILQDIDDRIFIAYRRLQDGASAYFLSVTDVSRYDQGEYFCKVGDNNNFGAPIATASFNFTVTYFPPEGDPVCNPRSISTIDADFKGTELTCSSAIGNPPVDIYWRKYGETSRLNGTTTKSGSRIQTTLKITSADLRTIFTCEVLSKAYPGRNQTCKIGPLRIGSTGDDREPLSTIGYKRPEHVRPTKLMPYDKGGNRVTTSKEQFCSDKCLLLKSPTSRYPFWIITTAVTSVIAIMMLCLILILYFKYIRRSDMHSQNTISRRQYMDDIYTELEIKRNENSVYMTLPKKPKQTTVA